jgi:hypothetical protein
MEKIMSKIDCTSNLGLGTLADSELDAVSGGMLGLTGAGGFDLGAACVAIASTGVPDGLSTCLSAFANSLAGAARR